jgi:hypothetical protein
MFKLVIWIDLNAQSVCTYQIWIFLVLWCSTRLEDSKDYKFIIFGWTEQKIWIKQANRCVWFNLKIDSNWILNLWIIMALIDSSYRSKYMNYQSLCSNQIQNSNLNRIRSGSWHVSYSYSRVPIRVDLDCEPLDLIRTGRPR